MNSKSHFTKIFNFISSALFSNIDYVYDRNHFNNKVHDNYDITDTTELKLISSRRTFL